MATQPTLGARRRVPVADLSEMNESPSPDDELREEEGWIVERAHGPRCISEVATELVVGQRTDPVLVDRALGLVVDVVSWR